MWTRDEDQRLYTSLVNVGPRRSKGAALRFHPDTFHGPSSGHVFGVVGCCRQHDMFSDFSAWSSWAATHPVLLAGVSGTCWSQKCWRREHASVARMPCGISILCTFDRA